MGYVLNEDSTFTKIGHKKNKTADKQKYKRIQKMKRNSKCKNRK